MIPGTRGSLPLGMWAHSSLPPPPHHPPSFSLGPERRPRSYWRKGPFRPSRPAWFTWTPWPPGKIPCLTAQPWGKGLVGFVSGVQHSTLGSLGKERLLAWKMAVGSLCLRITSYLEERRSCACQCHAGHTPATTSDHMPLEQIPIRCRTGETWPVCCPSPHPGLVTTEHL